MIQAFPGSVQLQGNCWEVKYENVLPGTFLSCYVLDWRILPQASGILKAETGFDKQSFGSRLRPHMGI